MSDIGIYANLKAAELVSSTQGNVANNAISIIQQGMTRIASYQLLSQANSSSNVGETVLAVQDFAAAFVGGNITVPANVSAANASAYAVLTILARTAGGASRVVAVANTSNVPVTAWTPLALTVPNAANAQVAAGDVLTYTIVQTGTPGVVLGTSSAPAVVDLSYRDI